MTEGVAVRGATDRTDLPTGPWASLGVLAAWVAACLLICGLLLRRRGA